MQKKFALLGLYSFTFLFYSFVTIPVHAQTNEHATRVYTIGVVPQFETRKLLKIWQPIVSYLKQETGYQFEMNNSPNIPEFEKKFMDGDFDFAYMNPYHMILANEKQGYIPIVRDIGRELYGVLVVKKTSDITDVAQLEGKKVAFPAPNALGATLLLKHDIVDNFKIDVHSVYVKTHDSVYLNVLLEQTSAGGGVQKTLNKQKSKYKSALRVLHKTRKVNPHPLAKHPRVPLVVASAVENALLKLGKTTEGEEMLAKIPIKKIGSSSMDDYQLLKSLHLERFFVR